MKFLENNMDIIDDKKWAETVKIFEEKNKLEMG